MNTTTLPPECIADMEARGRVIAKANLETDALTAQGVKWSAREMVQGIEITIERGSFKGRDYVARSYRIIPWESQK